MPVWHKAICWTNADLLSIWTSGTNPIETVIKTKYYLSQKLSSKFCKFLSGLHALTHDFLIAMAIIKSWDELFPRSGCHILPGVQAMVMVLILPPWDGVSTSWNGFSFYPLPGVDLFQVLAIAMFCWDNTPLLLDFEGLTTTSFFFNSLRSE